MKHITICIEYAGLSLPVVKNEKGIELVPLKPISDLFGLQWKRQYLKTKEDWTARFLGVCVVPMYHAGDQNSGNLGVCIGLTPYAGEQKREMVCIRLDRVAAYLMTLSPAKIRAAGNASGADFLEARLNEWADALHDYETLGAAVNPRHSTAQATARAANAAVKLIRAKALAASRPDRLLIDGLLQQIAAESGLPYQPDMLGE